jgi:hypothetical protein
MLKNVAISDNYSSPLWRALIHSGIIAILSGLMLDGGQTAILSAIGLAVFWGTVAVIICRRPQNPTSCDLHLIRWGCLPLVVGFEVAIFFVWHWRGLI